MNPSRPFILRPVATSLLMVAIVILGAIGYLLLPVSTLPEVDYPTIVVSTYLPGASPEVMSATVTAPLERDFGEMSGLDQMSSKTSAGASQITLQFDLNLGLDVAEAEVQAAINSAQMLLPQSLPAPPVYAKVNPADAPILTLALTSKAMPITQVENLADTSVAERISQVSGVGLVSLSGAPKPAARIEANLDQLAAYGLSLDNLRTTIANSNSDAPKGSFNGPAHAYTIDANDQLTSPAEYANLVVAYRNGSPVLLKNVAKVVMGAENNQLASWVNNTPAVLLNIRRQPDANVIQVVQRIRALLPRLRATLPSDVNLRVVTDRTQTIRASVDDVQFELALAVALVVMVMFLFLRSIPATIIPSLSVPVSLIGTFAVMYLAGFSLDNLSLMALTVASGFVVDDAIVMIENISRHIEQGKRPLEAALEGSGEIAFTIVSLTISLIAVLIPLLFMRHDRGDADRAIILRGEIDQHLALVDRHVVAADPDVRGQADDVGIAPQHGGERLLARGHGLEGDRRRSDRRSLQQSRVLQREEALGNDDVERHRQDQRAGGDPQHQPLVRQGPLEPAPVRGNQPIERRLGLVGPLALFAQRLGVRPQDLRAQHRHQRQGDHRGDQDGDGQRDREFPKQPADHLAHEQQRNQHRDQRDGERDDGEGDLPGTLERRLDRSLAALDVPRDVLDHDDGVIDHEPRGDRQGHQRQVVETEAREIHHREGAGVAHRHLCGDVPRGLQPGQPVVDGAHHRLGVRGR